MVTIATFNEPAKAKHLKDRLQQSGVKADVHNEGQMQAVAFMGKPQANAKVMVHEQDFEKAHTMMVEWETSDPEIGRRDSLPELPVTSNRISADDSEVSHTVDPEPSFCAEAF